MSFFIIKIKPNKGFTLMEIMIVVIIVALLVGLAIPKYEGITERARTAEAINILSAVVDAQERYNLETNLWADDIAKLDIDIPAPENFSTLTLYATCSDAAKCADIKRDVVGSYTLSIDRDGDISCVDGVGAPTCAKAGY